MKNTESRLQQSCIKYFDLQYPQYKQLLFAIPNGGKRGKVTASIMKAEGVRRGIADLFLSIPKECSHGMYIEMKTKDGIMSPEQKTFRDLVRQNNYLHVVCRDLEQFILEVNTYLSWQ